MSNSWTSKIIHFWTSSYGWHLLVATSLPAWGQGQLWPAGGAPVVTQTPAYPSDRWPWALFVTYSGICSSYADRCPSTCWAEDWAATCHLTLDMMSCTSPKVFSIRWIFTSLEAAPASCPYRDSPGAGNSRGCMSVSTSEPSLLPSFVELTAMLFVYSDPSTILTD